MLAVTTLAVIAAVAVRFVVAVLNVCEYRSVFDQNVSNCTSIHGTTQIQHDDGWSLPRACTLLAVASITNAHASYSSHMADGESATHLASCSLGRSQPYHSGHVTVDAIDEG